MRSDAPVLAARIDVTGVAGADCPPVRVRILWEDLVAFRGASGQVRLPDEWCAHRRTSLWLGRNEVEGLRCVFHGRKYDATGQCVDMPNELPEFDFKEKVRIKAYPTQEMGSVIWAYLGPDKKQPPPPSFEWTRRPESHLHVSKGVQDCNWLQALEGGLDSIHTSFLHRRFAGSGRLDWAGLEHRPPPPSWRYIPLLMATPTRQ